MSAIAAHEQATQSLSQSGILVVPLLLLSTKCPNVHILLLGFHHNQQNNLIPLQLQTSLLVMCVGRKSYLGIWMTG